MIHIVGLYKCGSSWLLHMLGAHPQVIAWREFDPVRATFAPDHRIHKLPATARDYFWRDADSASWMRRREASVARPGEERFRELFMGRGWIPAMGAPQQNTAARLPTHDTEELLDQLLELAQLRVRRSDAPLADPARHTNTLGVVNCRRQDLTDLMDAIQHAEEPLLVPALFYNFLSEQSIPETHTACKAADQLMQLDLLKRIAPDSRAIAIVRDGRDAAISARHYEALMRNREAPWRVPNTHAARRLLGWGVRAAKLAAHARRGEITVVRYEDLHANFDGICSQLLRHLDLETDAAIVSSIREETNFQRVSGGRHPGEAAEHVVRRGQVGEWRQAMNPREASLAWRLIGDELTAFGYGRDGELRESPLVLGA